MHGYIDSILVPLHLGPSRVIEQATTSASTSSSAKAKGKAKASHATKEQGRSSASDRAKHDLVGSWTSAEAKDMRDKVELAATQPQTIPSTVGYSTICLVISIPTTTDPSLLSFPTPLYPDLDPRTAQISSSSTPLVEDQILQLWRIHIRDYGDEQVKSVSHRGQFGLASGGPPSSVLQRTKNLTLLLPALQSQSTSSLLPPSTTLLSIQPTTLTSFSHVSLSLSASSPYAPSLITLDPSLSPRLPFPLKRGLIHTLQRSGLKIEIVYRGITCADEAGASNYASSTRRRNWISGAREIVRAMGGGGVVLSSWAKGKGEMRGVKDMINLCSLIGLDPTSAKEAISSHPQRVILKGLAMRQTYKGVFSNPSLITSTTTTTTTHTAAVAPISSTQPSSITSPTNTMNEKKRRLPSEPSEPTPSTTGPAPPAAATPTSSTKPHPRRPSIHDNGLEFVGVEVEVHEMGAGGGGGKRPKIK
ncbi:BZ3500_MvSof-1268-A1-R1_Chr11-3g03584 [Microbotryum saponariae]|uniref:BZ3500_MvSof-1268-A1-R1_Chr11-3g03584 protein n=1 Tax=Microbotryum saponariae TaxID=289078 RepID=A0A2X0LW34_9BASI|nr:BZ3500_MvSof-1268-A1-R1_Chr11-3g03584 [Microbotryum saponariae]SDA03593.1 BZ3501_MvSof-1269-A2-R1_Chr11g03161 [Microbotryum saponariae]